MKDGKEVDFCISENDILEKVIEVKLSKSDIDKNLAYFCKKYDFSGIQVVKNLSKEYIASENISVEKADNFLRNINY